MDVSDEDQYKVAVLESYETEYDAEILRISAVYRLKQNQISATFDCERKEAIRQVDKKEADALNAIQQECFLEEEDAKARHSVKLAAIKEIYQISDHLSAFVSQSDKPDSSSLATAPPIPVRPCDYQFRHKVGY